MALYYSLALVAVFRTACACWASGKLQDDGHKWTPADCGDNSIWDEQKKACRCNEGWTGVSCNSWANSTCYYQNGHNNADKKNYAGYLNYTAKGPCLTWKDHGRAYSGDLGKGYVEKNYCRNPDEDSNGIWCYVKTHDLRHEQEGMVRPEYCDAEQCHKEIHSYIRNGTDGPTIQLVDNNLEILYGPIIGGICGGLLALMTILGFCEYLRRRKTFHRLRVRFDPAYAHQQAAKKADQRKLGAINVVDIDTGVVEQQGGFTAGGQIRLDKGAAASTIGDNKSRVGGATTIGGKSLAGGMQSTIIQGTSHVGSHMSKGPAINRIISHDGLGHGNPAFDANSSHMVTSPKDQRALPMPTLPENGTSFGAQAVPLENINVDELSDYAGGDEKDDHDTGMMKFRKRRTIDEDYDEPRTLERSDTQNTRQRYPSKERILNNAPGTGKDRRRNASPDRHKERRERDRRKRRDSRERHNDKRNDRPRRERSRDRGDDRRRDRDDRRGRSSDEYDDRNRRRDRDRTRRRRSGERERRRSRERR